MSLFNRSKMLFAAAIGVALAHPRARTADVRRKLEDLRRPMDFGGFGMGGMPVLSPRVIAGLDAENLRRLAPRDETILERLWAWKRQGSRAYHPRPHGRRRRTWSH